MTCLFGPSRRINLHHSPARNHADAVEAVAAVLYITLHIENLANSKKADLAEGEELPERTGDTCGGVELPLRSFLATKDAIDPFFQSSW